MPELNKAVVGKEYPTVEAEITAHETIYYALGTNDPNPCYVDNTRDGGIIAPPMYAVNYGGGGISHIFGDKDLGSDFIAYLLHGEQEIEWYKAVKPGQKVTSSGKILSIEDKGTGELMLVESSTTLADSDEKVCRQLFSFFVRGYGKLEKKEKSSSGKDPENKSDVVFDVKENVFPGQTYMYAEPSGDHNIIHIDNEFAKKVGLDGIILQGLCTMAFCHKAVVGNAFGGDPTKLKKFSVRFSKPVFPGDQLTIKGWWIEKNKVLGFEAFRQNGDSVIKNGRAEAGVVSM